MRNVSLIFRVYMIEPKIKRHYDDMPIDLTLVSLNDGYVDTRNEFASQDEAVHFLQKSSTVLPDREYLIIPSCKVSH